MLVQGQADRSYMVMSRYAFQPRKELLESLPQKPLSTYKGRRMVVLIYSDFR